MASHENSVGPGGQRRPRSKATPLTIQSLNFPWFPKLSPSTRQIVADAIVAGIKHIWMQPGAEDAQASESARAAGINIIDDGSCILVLLAIMK